MESAQEVVMIQDSAVEVCVSFIKWALKGLPLKAGDRFTLVSILHQVNTPLGYVKVDPDSTFGANPRIVESEAERIRKVYENHGGLVGICQLYEKLKVEFKVEVATGPSMRLVGVAASKSLTATLVILDRKMKNDRSYFLDNLSCGIWRIKGNCKIEQLRAPKVGAINPNNKNNKLTSAIIFSDLSTIKRPMSDDQTSSSTPIVADDQELFSIEFR